MFLKKETKIIDILKKEKEKEKNKQTNGRILKREQKIIDGNKKLK
jgi:hypothetical protein